MNHLTTYKIFESTETKLYHKLPEKHYDNIKEYLLSNIISMSYDNRMVINNFYRDLQVDYKKPVYKVYDDTMGDGVGEHTSTVIMCIDRIISSFDMSVYELIDDYFMVFIFNGSYLMPYMCDTIQGVVQLLFDFDQNNIDVFNSWDKSVMSDLYSNWMW